MTQYLKLMKRDFFSFEILNETRTLLQSEFDSTAWVSLTFHDWKCALNAKLLQQE